MTAESRAWTLPAAAALAALEALALIAVVALRGEPRAPLVIPFLAVKLPFCWLVLRRHAGAYLGLLLWEFGAIVVAATAGGVPPALRALVLVAAAAVIALLMAAAVLFPRVGLPATRD